MEVILAQRPGEDSYTPDWRELETHENLHVLVPHFETTRVGLLSHDFSSAEVLLYTIFKWSW